MPPRQHFYTITLYTTNCAKSKEVFVAEEAVPEPGQAASLTLILQLVYPALTGRSPASPSPAP